jgi:hypothetical protein
MMPDWLLMVMLLAGMWTVGYAMGHLDADGNDLDCDRTAIELGTEVLAFCVLMVAAIWVTMLTL